MLLERNLRLCFDCLCLWADCLGSGGCEIVCSEVEGGDALVPSSRSGANTYISFWASSAIKNINLKDCELNKEKARRIL